MQAVITRDTPASPDAFRRPKWEYHTEVVKVDAAPDRLDELGDAGWELLQVIVNAPTHRELWLKRRR